MLLTIGPFILVAAILFLEGFTVEQNRKGGVSLDRSLLRLPLFGKIFFMSELFQLSNLLSALIWSGIGLTENLRLCERTIKNRYMRSQFRAARALVNEGKSLPDALRRFKFMPLMQLDIIEVGEKTGNLGNSVEDACKSLSGRSDKENKGNDNFGFRCSPWLCILFSRTGSNFNCDQYFPGQ